MDKSYFWIVYLWGNGIFGGHSNIGLLENLDNIDNVIKDIQEKYNIKFSSNPKIYGWSKVYNNITDDRDIKLVIETVDMINK